MQIKENTSIHPGKISLGVGRYASSPWQYASSLLLVFAATSQHGYNPAEARE